MLTHLSLVAVLTVAVIGWTGLAATAALQLRNPPGARCLRDVAETRPEQLAPLDDTVRRYAAEINEAAARFGLPPELVRAVIRVESVFDPHAVSRKGARGLMQLMPRTAFLVGVRDPLDPRQNIHGGARHLRGLITRYGGDLPLALAAYNAGTGPVAWHRGIPPYPETQQYVRQILSLLDRHRPDAFPPSRRPGFRLFSELLSLPWLAHGSGGNPAGCLRYLPNRTFPTGPQRIV